MKTLALCLATPQTQCEVATIQPVVPFRRGPQRLAITALLFVSACHDDNGPTTPEPGTSGIDILYEPGASTALWPVRVDGQPIDSLDQYMGAVRVLAQGPREAFDPKRFAVPHEWAGHLLPSSKRLVVRCRPEQEFGWLHLAMVAAGFELWHLDSLPPEAEKWPLVYRFDIRIGGLDAVVWEEAVWPDFDHPRPSVREYLGLRRVDGGEDGVRPLYAAIASRSVIWLADSVDLGTLSTKLGESLVSTIEVPNQWDDVERHNSASLGKVASWALTLGKGQVACLDIAPDVPIGIAVAVMRVVGSGPNRHRLTAEHETAAALVDHMLRQR
jgi:hypothetical protein